MFNLR